MPCVIFRNLWVDWYVPVVLSDLDARRCLGVAVKSRRLAVLPSARWFRPLVLTLVLVLVGSVTFGGARVRLPGLVDASHVVTPKQRSGSAKGRAHAVAASVTAAKPDGKKRVPKRPKNALPLETAYRPVPASAKTGFNAKKAPVRRAPAHQPPKVRGFDAKSSREVPAQHAGTSPARSAAATPTPATPTGTPTPTTAATSSTPPTTS